jgi:microcystin-dependent protein
MAENFDLIFGQSAGSQYAWSESDYQNGWETVGNTPPTAQQFDALQRRSDLKAQELNNALTPLVNASQTDNRQPSTAYSEGDIKYSPLLPTGWFLTCTVSGTTSASELVVPSPVAEGDEITDGDVTWKVKKIGGAGDAGDGVPLGAIIAYSANGDLPAGYLLCDGAAYSRTALPDLFAAIGTTYGSGDGSTTFNVPDYNTAERFAQGSTVAGTVKQAGLPNISGGTIAAVSSNYNNAVIHPNGAFNFNSNVYATLNGGSSNTMNVYGGDFDASRSSSVYGNSDTVQPNAITCRYVIKAFNGQTADSALIDITQYAQELAGKANITGSNLVYHRDVITTSGTYTAPVTGLYKITVKGGGGGGANGVFDGTSTSFGGGGGGEGGTTLTSAIIIAGDEIPVIIGAGGANGTTGANGGNSTVTVNTITYTAGGGAGGGIGGGDGGTGTIPGAPGGAERRTLTTTSYGANGGGAGGGASKAGVLGGGGGGGDSTGSTSGFAGGDGYVWFEYYTPGA